MTSVLSRALIGSAALTLVAGSGMVGVTTASADTGRGLLILPPECDWGPSNLVTCTWTTPNSAGTPSYLFSVPPGLTDVSIRASGGAGGDVTHTTGTYPGGKGATVTGLFGASLNSQQLTIVVGGKGGNGTSGSSGGTPGYPDGGAGGSGNSTGAGGGASTRVTVGATAEVIAGGGGGAGWGNDSAGNTTYSAGGSGGNGGAVGGNGGHAGPSPSFFARGGFGGSAALGSTPGNGGGGGTYNTASGAHCDTGSVNGLSGIPGSGPMGGNGQFTANTVTGSGGGGGGYAGGGAGGMGAHCLWNGALNYYGGGGGGGGGSSYSADPSAVVNEAANATNTGNGSVIIQFTLIDDVAPFITVSQTPNGTNGFNKTSPVTVSVNAGDSDSGLSGPPTCTDDGNPVAVTGSLPDFTASISGDGTHAVQCTATDDQGNTATASKNVKVDTTVPTLSGVTDQGDGSQAAFTVTFSEPVGITDPNGLQFVESEDATNLPGNLTCASGVTALGLCQTWSFVPSQATIPGDIYDVYFQASTGQFIDRAGNEMAQTHTSVRGTTLIEDLTDPTLAYQWASRQVSGTIGGSLTRERDSGASFTYAFNGKKLTWFTLRGPDQGRADVTITKAGSPVHRIVNNYSATVQKQASVVFKKLGAGSHTITITVTGSSGNPNATNHFVSIDALKVGSKATTDNPSGRYTWGDFSEYRATEQASATLNFTFYGSGVSWGTGLGPDSGKARVLIDGSVVQVVDLYSATGQFAPYNVSGLGFGRHTLQIVALGKKNPLSTGKLVMVHRMQIL